MLVAKKESIYTNKCRIKAKNPPDYSCEAISGSESL
jgi:hypothetical protein